MWKNLFCAWMVSVIFTSPLVCGTACPFADDIAPCQCTRDGETQELDLDCSSVLDVYQLERIFEAKFPSSVFRRFKMTGTEDRPVPIVYLSDGLFANLTFRSIVIRHTDISHVGERAFQQSQPTLESLTLSHSQLTVYPATNIPYFSQLSLLDLSYNKMVYLQDIHSGSLQVVYLEHNEELSFSEHLLAWVPSLLEINMEFCGIQMIPPGLFTSAPVLSNVNLAGNKLTHLDADALKFSSEVLEIILSENLISGIDKGFISGTSGSADLMILNNELTDIPEEVWRSPLQYLSDVGGKGFVALDGNPFICGCNIAWLITSPDLLKYVARGAKCDDGSLLHDLNPEYFQAHCT